MCSNSRLVRNLGLGLLEWQRWLGMMAHTWSPQCEDIPEHSKNFRLQVGRVLKRTRLPVPLKYLWWSMRSSCKVLVAQRSCACQSPWTRAEARKTLKYSERPLLLLPPHPVLCRLPTPPAAACRPPPTTRCTTPPGTAQPPQEPLHRLQFRRNPVLRGKT